MALPDMDALVLAILRDAMSGQAFGTQIPSKLASKLPFVMAVRFSGSAVDPRFLDSATIDVQTWAGDRKEAFDLAFDCRSALMDAWLNATVYPDLGHLTHFREVTGPAELRTPDQQDQIWRTQATYSLTARGI